MKAIAPSLPSAVAPERGWISVYCDLFKARLTFLVLITAAVGYHLGCVGPVDWVVFLSLLGGTSLLAAGAAALNQLMEREFDALMVRTSGRPLPSGRLEPSHVLWLGVLMSVAGAAWLSFSVNPLTGVLGILTLISYLFVYTPLKRRTPLNTLAGAVPGAFPPLMGWTAATGQLDRGGWVLFAILFFWQLPHFMAIAWLYRDDYARAGFRMLPLLDPDGSRTSWTALRHTLALTVFSLAPYLLGLVGRWYVAGALILGALFFAAAVAFARNRDRLSARRLFFASIVHLPLLLGLLVVDKIRN